jgi:DNA (cytosine-5)-methyltransferase 1
MNVSPPPLRYGSICSGIEAVSVAWEPLGFEPAWFAEIDRFASCPTTAT